MRRYGPLTALLYDVFSGERPFYRAARLAAIEALHLAPGDRVLVLGSGTGLDLPLIAQAIGPSGTIVAVDRSPTMLHASGRRARRRAGNGRRAGWPRLLLVQADATRAVSLLPPGEDPVDAVLAVNTLSLIGRWRDAWASGMRTARPGARVAVADIGRPAGNAVLGAWSRLISFIGGGDLDARPWTGVEQDVELLIEQSWWRGHVQLRAGSLPRR